MSPFLKTEELISVFGENLLEKKSLLDIYKELTGVYPNKPFECVGTIEEVNACLDFCQKANSRDLTPVASLENLLNQYDEMNNLPEQFEAILKDNLFKNN